MQAPLTILDYFQVFQEITVGFGALLVGIAAIIALFRGRSWYEQARIRVTEETLRLERQELQRRLRFEVAQEAVDRFHRVKVDFDLIRLIAVNEGEMQALKELPETNEMIRKAKKNVTAGVVLMRLDERAESVAAINRLRPKFKAMFDDESPFATVVRIRHKIYVAAHILLEDLNQEQVEKYEDVVLKTSEEDELSSEMITAVNRIEELCFPVLRGDLSMSSR